jgi:hypothetical protein
MNGTTKAYLRCGQFCLADQIGGRHSFGVIDVEKLQ